MNELIPFNYECTSVRVTTGEDGEPRFVLADLCHVLALGNTSMVARRLTDSMKGVSQIDTPGGAQRMTTVTEAGMYAVVMRSDKPEAVRFQEWVTGEVLPSIRRHGMYATDDVVAAALADPDTMIRTLTALKEERAARAALEAKTQEDAPKVLFADAVATSHTAILVGDLAKILCQNGVEVGANRLFEWLRRHKFLVNRKGTDWNSPTQRAQEMGLFRVKETAVTHSDGHVTVNRTPKVTGKGQTYFVSRFLDGRFQIDDEEMAA